MPAFYTDPFLQGFKKAGTNFLPHRSNQQLVYFTGLGQRIKDNG